MSSNSFPPLRRYVTAQHISLEPSPSTTQHTGTWDLQLEFPTIDVRRNTGVVKPVGGYSQGATKVDHTGNCSAMEDFEPILNLLALVLILCC